MHGVLFDTPSMAFNEFPDELVQINKSGHNIKHLVAVSDNQNMPL
jgi:hypothetical protein